MILVVYGSVLSGARGFVGWSRTDLAKRLGVDRRSIDRLEEDGRNEVNLQLAERARKLLEAEGLEFILAGEGRGPGVRWRSEVYPPAAKDDA